jgi:hypothetical protein
MTIIFGKENLSVDSGIIRTDFSIDLSNKCSQHHNIDATNKYGLVDRMLLWQMLEVGFVPHCHGFNSNSFHTRFLIDKVTNSNSNHSTVYDHDSDIFVN